MKYVFGPVPSRRLGRSLGVDLIPYKTCSYDCVYCQLGRTTDKTIARIDRAPLEAILDDIRDGLGSRPDYITLSGSGEPTLYPGIGDLIGRIHEITDIPVAVLTNGSLLWMREVRGELRDADLVIPSLDAGSEEIFKAVNRPVAEITFERLLDGLISFREEYSGEYWLEIMLVGGFTSATSEIKRIAGLVERINPDRVQLNTVIRPPAETFATGIEKIYLQKLTTYFSRPVEIIADYKSVHLDSGFATTRDAVLGMIARRPCSADDIANGLRIHRNEVVKHIEELSRQKSIDYRLTGGKVYYVETKQRQN